MLKYLEENYIKKEMIKMKKYFIFSNIIHNKMNNLKTSKTKIIIWLIFNESFKFFA